MSPRAHFWLRFFGIAALVTAQLLPRASGTAKKSRDASQTVAVPSSPVAGSPLALASETAP